MRKGKQQHPMNPPGGRSPSPTQAAEFLEDFRNIVHGQNEPAQLISLRVPANVLRSFKLLAARRGRRYQPHIVQLMRDWILKEGT